MKKLILLISLLAGMSSCYHEDALIIPDQLDKYNILKDDPSDPTQHFRYQFYQKYQTVIITNPTGADYEFNFTSDNGIKIMAPEQNKEVINDGIDFLQRTLLDLYPDNFLKKNLPFSIILAEEVRMDSYGETAILNCYASGGFIALGNVTVGLKTMTQKEFYKIRADVNASFWARYMSQVRGLFIISDAFYEASEEVEPDIYSPNWFYFGYDATPYNTDFYHYGLISYDPERSFVDEADPDFPWYSLYAPSKETDLSQWMNFVFLKTPVEIQEICDKYPVMKKKYDIIREAMLENGFDLSKLEL
ncbi:hypothetical protein [Bacteroides faecalis]|uniref:DUF4843 domain-containing protein n=1 Tax=Bacteroides faecalis TaxID=2447885 RepID=A0A401LW06_9BACE|nr:hypothetical protein [Bacteroides faecalis]GCB35716.1 hypothetical protein KGMB02408_26610 [Bacteroides faecalis]